MTLALDDTCPDGDNCDKGAPIADAGPDREISEGESLSIDGSQSNDPNGDDLQYHWEVDNSLISGSQEGSQLDVTGPEVQKDTDYTVTLKVTDKDGNSDSDHMSLKVIDTNGPNPEPIPCEENGNMTGPDCPVPNPEPIPCEENGNMTGPDCPVPNPEPIPCEENGNMTGPDCPVPNPEPIPCEKNGNMTGPDCPVPNPEPIPCEENGNMTGNGTTCIPNPVPQPPCEYGNMTGNANCPGTSDTTSMRIWKYDWKCYLSSTSDTTSMRIWKYDWKCYLSNTPDTTTV